MNNKIDRQRYATGMAMTVLLLGAVACCVFFQGWYHHHFFYQEQNQLFLWSADYLGTYFNKPGWLACMAGDFLTQFYYYLYAGPMILGCVLFIVGTASWQAFRKAGLKNGPLAVAAALAVMAVEASLSLHHVYRLGSILAVIGGTTMFILYRRMKSAAVNAAVTVVAAMLTFWLFGYGMWIFLALVLIRDVANTMRMSGNKALATSLWWVAVMVTTTALTAATKRLYYLDFRQLAAYPGIGKFTMPETELERIFAVEDEYYFGNHNKLVAMVEGCGNPNQYELFYYNLVMAQQGQLTDKLLKYSNNVLGTFDKIGPDTPMLKMKMLSELYWVLGDMTFAERAAMLANVFSPDNRNLRMMRRLAEVNIVSGDKAAALKYLRILQKTFVLNRWATQRIDALACYSGLNQSFSSVNQSFSDGKAAVLKPYIEKAGYINRADTLRLRENTYVVMQELIESNPDNKTALDYMLCSDLLLKDIETFKRDYDNFYLKQKAPQYEKLYQEAIMIYLAGTNATPKEWQRYVKRNDIAQRFIEYNKQRGSVSFRDTYWYYFDKGIAPKINN